MDDKIKYVLNGTIKYYTDSELREYFKNLLIKSDAYSEELFCTLYKNLLEDLKLHDGDPYGYLEDGEYKTLQHKTEAEGRLFVHKCDHFKPL